MKKRNPKSYMPVSELMKTEFISLDISMSVREALDFIRNNTIDEQIVYFYVTDNSGHLKGVVSTRSLLLEPFEKTIKEIMKTRVRSVPLESTIIDLWSEFIFHKYLALPVVDKDHHLVGAVDITAFTENVSDVMERDVTDQIFETIGFKLSQVRDASVFKVFRYRFPWLTATITSGIISAIMVSKFELVLSETILLAFFLTLVLGLGESVSMQSMTVTIQALKNIHPTLEWYAKAIFKELKTALALGVGSGLLVFSAIVIWQRELFVAGVIGGSIVLSLTMACLLGLSIPALLHLLRWDLKIASGPLTLALADLVTIIIYFGIASFFL